MVRYSLGVQSVPNAHNTPEKRLLPKSSDSSGNTASLQSIGTTSYSLFSYHISTPFPAHPDLMPSVGVDIPTGSDSERLLGGAGIVRVSHGELAT